MNLFTENPTKTIKPAHWIGSLQGLRAIAFLAIFLSHTGIGPFGCFGTWGVSVFLMMSGFLMSYQYLRKPESPTFGLLFAWSKIKKLYPLHLIMMIGKLPFTVANVLRGWLSMSSFFFAVGLNIALFQIWIPCESIYTAFNGPSWFLDVIALAYLFFPLFLRVLKKIDSLYSALKYIFLFVSVHVLLSFVSLFFLDKGFDPETIKWLTYYFPPVRCCDFGIGCVLGWLYLHRSSCDIKHINNIKQVLWQSLCFLMIAVSMYFYTFGLTIFGSDAFRFSLLFLPSTILLIWLVSTASGYIEKVWSVKPLELVAKVSPYAFLIHDVVILYVREFFQIFFPAVPLIIASLISLFLTLLLSRLWLYISTSISFNCRVHSN